MGSNGQLQQSELAPIAQGFLRKDCAAAWNSMNAEARKLGCELLPNGSKSSYRTLAQQRELYDLFQHAHGSLAAVPGSSNHGWGLAVDVATQQMRAMIDRIGARWGFEKRTSDAPSEWWHLKWREGSWHGPDPGPYGQSQPAPPIPIPEPPEGVMAIHAVVKQNGAIELFCEVDSGPKKGEVFHTWQNGPNTSWWGAEKGKRNAAWQSLGNPSK